MRIAAKIFTFILVGIVVVLALDGYLAVERELDLFDRNMRIDARVLGGALREAVAETWRRAGERRARGLIQQAGRGEDRMRIRWVWLDAPAGDKDAPSVPPERIAQARKGRTVVIKHGRGKAEHLFTYLPLSPQKGRMGALELAESLANRNAYARETLIRQIWLLGGITLVSGLLLVPLGLLLVGRPLALLADKARRVGDGDLSGQVSIRGRDELGELADSMNQMCEHLDEARQRLEGETAARIETLEQLRHADRLKSVGRLAAGMAHELGTPLNVVSARAGLIASGKLEAEEQTDSARIIKEQAARMTSLIRQMLDFARKHPVQRSLVDLGSLAEEARELLASEASKSKITLSVSKPEGEDVVALADPKQMTQVLMTLIVNAMQSMPDGGEVDVEVCRAAASPPVGLDMADTELACLRVRDRGEGIDEEALRHIFEPFYTTKDIGQGTGLGLSVAHGIIAEHGGWISVTSELGGGSVFSVYLPPEVRQ